jgi:hypothetical protein
VEAPADFGHTYRKNISPAQNDRRVAVNKKPNNEKIENRTHSADAARPKFLWGESLLTRMIIWFAGFPELRMILHIEWKFVK